MTAPGEVRVVDDLILEPPRTGEVMVEVRYCGLCLTDVHIMQGHLGFPTPAVCGHEVAGVVVEVGPGVDSLSIGAHVVLACRPPCRRCYWCVRGEPQLCGTSLGWRTGILPDGGTRLSWGGQQVYRGVGVAGLAERVVVPAAGAVRIPDDVPLDIAAVLGCAVQTGAGAVFNTARLQPGQTALVLGLGGVGTAAVQAARASGASTVIGVDPRPDRRKTGLAAGADVVLDPAAEDVVASVRAATDGIGVDLAFDLVGDPDTTVRSGFAALRPGPGAQLTLPAAELVSDERRVSGCFLGSADPHVEIPRLLELWRLGRLDLSVFVTDRRPLSEVPQLLDGAASSAGLRTVIEMGGLA
jgi:S-(hydroxymethyl)glutathione dehydrogenase/alcohol dehydrogenase